ncbi:YlbG family protein [Bacillus spongiae]|uniref:UPF0298 protein WAK64_03065 n=1 Tax=Bacillus spongiae TaxID=2683610 RepID=A0ABU8H9V6_9BACI
MLTERQGMVVWLYHLKHAKSLRRFGHVHYVSKKLKYVVIYCNKEDIKATMGKLSQFSYVKKVEPSFKPSINTEYENSKPDKAKEYDYKIGL